MWRTGSVANVRARIANGLACPCEGVRICRSQMNTRERSYPITVSVFAFDGCMTSAVTGLLDALQIANLWALTLNVSQANPFVTSIVAPSTSTVRGSGGFMIPAIPMADAPRPDIAVVPPIMAPIQETLAANQEIVQWLRSPHGAVVASVCAGAFFLAEAGLLSGRRATTNPAFASLFRQSYADVELVPEERLVDTGQVLCAGSTTAFLDLGVYLIDRFVGHEVAVLTAKTLCVDKNHRSQLPYFLYVAPKDHGDSAVLAQQAWLEEHYVKPLDTDALAQRGAMSQRSLNRRFRTATGMTPGEYLHRIRVEAAKRLLETSDLSVDQVTSQVGYQDARSFSRLFRSFSGLAPTEYRTRFGSQRA
jgi:transcriptional regulator GlxA family with amidase domain